ncbi:MAG: hypothetical protein ABJB40_00410 [Acidobacteriota bacterium]
MIDRLYLIIKAIFLNKIGWVGIAFNSLLVIIGAIQKGDNFRWFHFYYEPVSIKLFFLLNIPPFVMAEWVDGAFRRQPLVNEELFVIPYDVLFLVGIFSVVQWLVVGYVLKSIFGKKSA